MLDDYEPIFRFILTDVIVGNGLSLLAFCRIAQKKRTGQFVPARFAKKGFLCAEKDALQQFKLIGDGARLDAVVDVQFTIDALNLGAHSVDRDHEFAGDLGVRVARSQ